ncbi:DUF423 domain-containing protein [Labilibacter marinus]|uniref:DUF423 domain-containing protein n=1 Tax=Labilibacter marinus TaxID=1477105 RepID=UPI00082F101D|nr:DUF423 domain-containing protein [Labilibacter marinus]
MKKLVLLFGASYGLLSVIFGAFGAHALKKVLPETALQSFETGVRYQMYHGILLLLIGFFFAFETKLENYMAWSFIVGTILFSFSIYLLALNNQWGYQLRFLGPITPLGGLFLIIGWLLLLVLVFRRF